MAITPTHSGSFVGPDGNIYTSRLAMDRAYQAKQKEAAQTTRMKNLAETQMRIQTQAAQDAFNKAKAGADTSGTLAAKFLEAWGSSLNDVKSMYGDAASVIKGLMDNAAIAPDLGGLKDLSNLMKEEYTSYKEQYAPMEKEYMTMARDTAQEKRAIQGEIAKGGGAWTDTEGAAARAKTDVAIQGEIQNQAEARRLLASGIDPSSGRFGALTRKGAIDLAGETVRAMNLARENEKTQGLQRAIGAAGTLNPGEYANIGMAIRSQGTDILKGAGALEQAGVQAQSDYAKTMGALGTAYAGMAGGMARDISNPLAEMAGYFTGMSGGNTGAINMPQTNPMQDYLNLTAKAPVMQGQNFLNVDDPRMKKQEAQTPAIKQPSTKPVWDYESNYLYGA
jgi:hypothetical protein